MPIVVMVFMFFIDAMIRQKDTLVTIILDTTDFNVCDMVSDYYISV